MSNSQSGTLAGLSAYSGREDALGIVIGKGKIILYTRENNKQLISKMIDAPRTNLIYLRMKVTGGRRYRFDVSVDGYNWSEIGKDISGSYLEGGRIALTVGGTKGASARFESLKIEPSQ